MVPPVVPPLAASSLLMTPVAVAVPNTAPVAPESVTVKLSSGSTVVSPTTLTVMTFEVSPAAKLTEPDGAAPPWKSLALAGLVPEPLTDQATLEVPLVSPDRVTVKAKAVVPLFPSGCVTVVGESDSVGAEGGVPPSSFWISPVALPAATWALAGLDRETVNPSSGSDTVSPTTLMVMALLVSPAAKLTTPDGRTPPWKSAALAAWAPDPATCQTTLEEPLVSPVRMTV